jgi:SAM-dependent methyltransferase
MTIHSYIGSELELFSTATNWKAYIRQMITPDLSSPILEVGAGIGGTTKVLCAPEYQSWLCLEPDPVMAKQLQVVLAEGGLDQCQARSGTLNDLLPEEQFNSILYVDVLEHIEDDRGELKAAISHLRPGGRLIVLSPAHQWLFTPFDQAIGHYRRYTIRTLAALTPPDATLKRTIYLDSVGLLASLGNRLILKSKMPTVSQIKVWDQLMVPLSKRLDPILGYSLGKSVIAVWEKKRIQPRYAGN